MTVNSGNDFKKTAIILMPQQYTELRKLDGSGMWPWTKEGKLREAAALGWNPSTSLPTSCQDSSSRSSQNFLSLLPFLRRKSHPILSSQRFPFLHPGKAPTQWNTDSSFVLDNVHFGLWFKVNLELCRQKYIAREDQRKSGRNGPALPRAFHTC